MSAVPRFGLVSSKNKSWLHLTWGNNATIKALLNGSTTPVGESPQLVTTGWNVFEVYYNYSETSGGSPNLQVKFNGITVITYNGATSIDPTDSLIEIHYGGTSCYLDDIALNDTTGSTDNSWCGDGHVIALVPNGNGDSSQFVGSDSNSVDNYQLVDERPPNGIDYVESATTGDFDLYQVSDITLHPQAQVKRVWVEAVARELSADGDGIQLGVKTANGLLWSPSQPLSLSYQILKSHDFFSPPGSSQPWTQTDLNGVQIGVRAS